jgi:hypothetical protein
MPVMFFCQYHFYSVSQEKCLKLLSEQRFESYNVPETGSSYKGLGNDRNQQQQQQKLGKENYSCIKQGRFQPLKAFRVGMSTLPTRI